MKSCFLSFFFFFFLLFPLTHSQTPLNEKQILLNIKVGWGTPSKLISWNPAGDHCQYAGIRCSNGSVVNINLYNSDISFPIPAAISDLKGLTFLNLSDNNIPGEFPSVVYNCSSLQKLDISNNYFVGEIPADVDKLPRNLTHLNIASNNFSGGIPAGIGRLPAIRFLCLDNNLFYGRISSNIGNLSTLEYLTLAYNPFPRTNIPPEFGNLTSLQYLWMSNMNLVGEIPDSLGKLANLEHLDLAMNFLVGKIPASIWMIMPLKNMYLYSNNLAGEISNTVACKELVNIDLSMNLLAGKIPEAFGEMKDLSILFLYLNNFSGQLPASIGLLPNLDDVRLFNNRLEGVLPPEMGKHSLLRNLEVSYNQFTGELPEHLCDRKAFRSLIVFNNQLSGKLPDSLGSCSTLQIVEIQNNNFSGEFPARIWSAANLSYVIASHNSLTGSLPEKLPWNLTLLEIKSNQFFGNIPSSSGGLLMFYGEDNNFSGEIPSSFFDMSMLQYLSLSGNKISGSIPASIGSMKSLKILDLSNNLLSGNIPDTIGHSSVLNTIDLSKNQLSGEIPSKLGDLNPSYLNLSFNDLSGEIPATLQTRGYELSFLANKHLCASNSFAKIQTCRNPLNRSDKQLSNGLIVLFSVLGSLLFTSLILLCFFITKSRRRKKKDATFPSQRTFTYFQPVDFNESTIFHGISDENLVGSGGGGKVYRVSLGRDTVAVKKIFNARKLDSNLEKEFKAEVDVLGSVRHSNIVKLLCCISGDKSKLLVYEYHPNGSLDRWLHRRKRGGAPPLDWPTRLQIAVGAARGLCYMHHDCSPAIIHRDVKSSNILLDAEFNSKIADFGLARILTRGGEPETVSAVAGSFGYMAPECGKVRKVNEKVDVFSFGVVLLELATGREARDGGEEEHENLTEWAWRRYKERGCVVDDEIAGESPEVVEEAAVVFKLGLLCTGLDPACRPAMKEVVQVLMKLWRGREDRNVAT